MTRAVLALLSFAAACGPPDDVGSAGVGIAIQGLVPADVGAVQLAVLKNGVSFDCATLSRNCLAQQVAAADYVPLTLDDNKQHTAALFDADGSQVVAAGQGFRIRGIPVGKNYLVVAEVLGPGRTELKASGCDLRQEIVKGENPALGLTARAIAPPPKCDPRIEK